MCNKLNILWLLLFLLVPLTAFGQADTLIPDLYGSAYLNAVIAADTAGIGNFGWLQKTRVYVLQRGGVFPWNAICTLQNDRKMKMRAEVGAGQKPMIWMYEVGTTDRPIGTMVLLKSDDILEMSDIDMAGYNQDTQAEVHGVQGQLFNILAANARSSMLFERCIMHSLSGNTIRTDGAPTSVIVRSCIFSDQGNCATSNLGAGKCIDVRNNVVPVLEFTNNTVVNFQDRMIRHYQSGANKIVDFKFNHNTTVNGMSYHGWLSLGSVGSAQINNNLLIDANALGQDTAAVRQAEFSDAAGDIDFNNGLPRIVWITAVNPGPTDTYEIKKNFYSVSDSGVAMYTTTAAPLGPPLYRSEGAMCTWEINKKLGADSLTAFIKTCIQPVAVPPLMTEFIRWLYIVRAAPDSGGGKGKAGNADPFWLRSFISKGVYGFDYHRQSLAYYKNTLDCDYRAGMNLATAGTDGLKIGDTRWDFLGACAGTYTSVAMAQGWNLVCVPRTQVDYTAGSVFPNAYGAMFTYDPDLGDYVEAPILGLGKGIWCYFTSPRTIDVIGSSPTVVIPCKAGWNLIGGRETVVPVASLVFSAGSIYGAAFKYDPSIGDYVETTTLDPGAGIWLYATQNCDITVP